MHELILHRVDENDPLNLRAGERVSVAPDDYGKVPVVGELLRLNIEEVTILRDDERVGSVVTHFPRVGYRIQRA